QVQDLLVRSSIPAEFFWFQEEDLFYNFLASRHVGVLPSSNDTARWMGTPVKLLDYISVGLPIVANHIGGWSEMINKYDIGITTSDSSSEFADAIVAILSDEDLFCKFRHNALELAKHDLSWNASAEKMKDLIMKVL